MKQAFLFIGMLFVLSSCSSSSGSEPIAESSSVNVDVSDSSAEDPAVFEDGYQAVSFGGYDTVMPETWIYDNGYYYINNVGELPFVFALVDDDYNSLDDMFPTSESIENYAYDASESFEDVAHIEPIIRRAIGNYTGLNFGIAGTLSGEYGILYSTLYSNPGGGVVSITLFTDKDSSQYCAAEYAKILYYLTPSDGLDAPKDSFQLTTGDKNALSKAKSYLELMYFSRNGLKEQLMFEGYTEKEATYAVDNCLANWKEQAAGKAKSYLESQSFSRSGLIEQLMFEGFTKSEAEYGVSQVYD